MFATRKDPNLLRFLVVVVLIGAIASALGLARFYVATTITGAMHANVGDVMVVGGYFGWYLVLLYAFSRPGARRLVSVVVPGLAGGLLFYFGMLRSLYPEANGFLLFGTLGFALGYPALAKMAYDRYVGRAAGEYREKLDDLLFACVAVLLLSFTPNAYLDIANALHPATFDAYLYHFEGTLGFQPSVVLARWAEAHRWFDLAVRGAYNVLPLTFGIVYGAQIARRDRRSLNLLGGFVLSALIAVLGYHLLPVCGPKYLLDGFPSSIPPVDEIPLVRTLIAPYPRNGVPSMHLGWALLLWLHARLLGSRLLYAFFSALLALNVLATMAIGEHYLIDLVIAVPVVVAVQAMLVDVLPWSDRRRSRALVGGFALWFAWVVALRVGVPLFESVPGLSWFAIATTLLASAWLYVPMIRAFERNAPAASRPAAPRRDVVATLARSRIGPIVAMFVISGFAGLMYEVLFSKSLALTFGGTASAMYTVLATYMAGMAIGSWLGGRIADSRPNPLILYAFCEMAVGLYCAATPLIFAGIRLGYVHVAGDFPPDAPALSVFRVAFGVAGLIVPTVLMGMTLPILARFFEQRAYSLGRSVAVLYAANTAGAALGALLVGYSVIPALGIAGTTMTAVVLNLLVALFAIKLHKQIAAAGGPSEVDVAARRSSDAALAPTADGNTKVGLIALVILGVGGIVTLAMETVYIHLLAVVAGNSTYAFSLMLFTFLLGLGAGAEAARRLLSIRMPLPLMLGWLEFGLAVVILAGVYVWDSMPPYFSTFAGYPLVKTFASREVVRGIVCFLAMFPPAFFIGALYPIAMEAVGRANVVRRINALGSAAAVNTAGNIVGVLAGGFVLLPIIGPLRSIQLLAAVCMVLGVVALLASSAARRFATWAPAALAVCLLAVQPGSLNYDSLASGANVYFAGSSFGKIIDHAESIDGGLTSVARLERDGQPPLLTLLTNGKFQGNDAYDGEMQAQLGFALAPLMHTSRRDSALVIGYGTGVSARTLNEAGYRHLDIVDLSADIVRLADQHFASVNAGVTKRPGVTTYITDGRNFLLLNERKYDLIGAEISSIWFAGAASLYNREFYSLAKQRLNEHGVLQQWMQLHHMSREDAMRILGSVRAEFRYVWLYLIGRQGVIVASNDPSATASDANLDALRRTATLQPLLNVFGSDPAVLKEAVLLDPPGTDRLLTSFPVPTKYWISTDDNLFLEYSTPKGNVLPAESYDDIVSFIKSRSLVRQASSAPAPSP